MTSALKTADGAEAVTPGAVPAAAVPSVLRRPSAALLSKPVEEDNSDNGYYDQLMAMLNKRR